MGQTTSTDKIEERLRKLEAWQEKLADYRGEDGVEVIEVLVEREYRRTVTARYLAEFLGGLKSRSTFIMALGGICYAAWDQIKAIIRAALEGG